MSAQALLIEVRWPAGRFHGVRDSPRSRRGGDVVAPEWPPSPFRLFQALVAGAYGGRWAGEDSSGKDRAFRWLENLEPPTVAAPPGERLQPVTYFVPNNDLDAKEGDPDRVNEIRSAKTLRTTLFDPARPVAYLWTFDGDDAPARRLTEIAERLHTLGHGMDAAFAHAELIDAAEGEGRLHALGGAPRKPSRGTAAGGAGVPCPARGSLDSLRGRHEAFRRRFERSGKGRGARTRFHQPPKAHARAVAYERPPDRLLYELTPVDGPKPFARWPLTETVALAQAVRDLIASSLGKTRPDDVERYVVGRDASEADKARRLRVTPLPSIGMRHTDPAIRRVLVELPPDHPLPRGDIQWALAARELVSKDGEFVGTVLKPASDRSMLRHYGVDEPPVRRWRTFTPAALPERAARRRIDPARLREDSRSEGKGASERVEEEARAAAAVCDALRHAGVAAAVRSVRVQREPFDLAGARAEPFALGTRFAKERLWHVEIAFETPVAGPLVIGDGRFLGLGLMRPVAEQARQAPDRGLHIFEIIEGPELRPAAHERFARALRRAVLARGEAARGQRRDASDGLPGFFHGHAEEDVDRDGAHKHLFFALDPRRGRRAARALILAPHHADRSPAVLRDTQRFLDRLARAVDGLHDLRAGALGRFVLAPAKAEADDPLLGDARRWTSLTDYRPTRHPRRGEDEAAFIAADLRAEAAARGLPRPRVEILSVTRGSRGGLAVHARLTFPISVAGPVLLGRTSHFGGGLFEREA